VAYIYHALIFLVICFAMMFLDKKLLIGRKIFRKNKWVKLLIIAGIYLLFQILLGETFLSERKYLYVHTIMFSLVASLGIIIGAQKDV